jgi:4-hydroxyphenylpyruvate dioxygenase
MSTVLQREIAAPSLSFLPFYGTDFVEFYVGNAQQAAYYYRMAMGMSWVAYAGPETGFRDRTSFVLQQGSTRFVLSTPLRPGTEMADHVHRHGDSVRDIALHVGDARAAWRESIRRGARNVREPFEVKDGSGVVRMASIAAYGDTVHTFVERREYRGIFLPGYRAVPRDLLARAAGIAQIDHVGINVGWSEMDRCAAFYSQVMGFSACRRFGAEFSTLLSAPAIDGSGRIRFLVKQPVEGSGKSSVEEYLEFNHGPGTQYIALSTTDILYTVARMREQGVEFAAVDPSYYTEHLAKPPVWLREPVSNLQKLGIQIAYDEEGPVLEIRTRPVEDRPTLFFKIVQRTGGPA